VPLLPFILDYFIKTSKSKTNTILSRTRRQNSRAAGLVKSVSLLRMLADEASRYEIAITLLSPSSADFGDNDMFIWLVLASLASIVYCRSASAVSSSQACFLTHYCIARLLEVLISELEHPHGVELDGQSSYPIP
jgi:hypothetical protein